MHEDLAPTSGSGCWQRSGKVSSGQMKRWDLAGVREVRFLAESKSFGLWHVVRELQHSGDERGLVIDRLEQEKE